jgi:hypothetical protein
VMMQLTGRVNWDERLRFGSGKEPTASADTDSD